MATERDVPVRLWRCPECRAEGFWPAEPLLPGGPALCGHPSGGYVSTLYVPAVLTPEALVEEIMEAQADLQTGLGIFRLGRRTGGRGGTNAEHVENRLAKSLARCHRLLAVLGTEMYDAATHPEIDSEGPRAAGFVSEPSTGGGDA